MARNNDDIFNLRTLAIDRELARKNLKLDSAAARERLKPANLVAEAKSKAADRVRRAGVSALDGIRANPGMTATVAATATLIAMRRPIARLIASQRQAAAESSEE